MNNILYNLLLHTVVPPLLAAYYLPAVVFGRKYRNSLPGKLGRLPSDFPAEALSRPRVWFHAVSVGEAVALSPLVRAMRRLVPNASFVVSTGTETGQAKARDLITEADGFFYLPLDFPMFVNRVINRIDPDLFVLMETELWPNLIDSLARRGTSVALANGRISDRSFPGYRRLRRFFSPVLAKMDLFLMSSELDAERIREIGGEPDRIRVTGNTKFDAALGNTPQDAEEAMRRLLDIEEGSRVLVAGSTHPGENEIVLDTFSRLSKLFPDLILIIVPRHVEKTPLILSAIRQRSMEEPFLRTSADRGETRAGRKIVVIDKTGELFKIFSLATVVFMGGSLAPKGGQNILEPVAWGKPVLFGPSMEDFREARDMIVRCGAGIEVRGGEDLAGQAGRMLSDPEESRMLGQKGRLEFLKHVGSAEKSALMLVELLNAKQ